MIPLPLVVSELVLAIGAALALGTLAALARYRRTGTFPNQPGVEGDPDALRATIRRARWKVAAGTLLALWGGASVLRAVA